MKQAADRSAPWPRLLRSSIEGVVWPTPLGGAGAQALAMQCQLEHTQWWSPQALLSAQLTQLDSLLRHAQVSVPFYRERIAGLPRDQPLTLETWRTLPLLTRAELQAAGIALQSNALPTSHGATHVTRSSGSTGLPVQVRKTELCALYWRTFTLRDHFWRHRDLSGTLATIRFLSGGAEAAPPIQRSTGWGSATAAFNTGPSFALASTLDIAEQVRLLLQCAPDYLLTYPSNLRALARHCSAQGIALPTLRETRTFGEALSDDLREVVRRAWNVPVADMYSADEIGYMALQCPDATHYHVMAEGVLLEVLDRNGRACGPGEVGRVVVTPLHNFAMPLLRYVIGDYAEVGEPCACGRGLPVLTRILGRTRNLLTLPDGRQLRPSMGILDYETVAPVRQAQLIQRSLEHIEVRLVTSAVPSKAQEQALTALIQARLGYPFRVTLTYVDALSRSRGGKFEDFISEVTDG